MSSGSWSWATCEPVVAAAGNDPRRTHRQDTATRRRGRSAPTGPVAAGTPDVAPAVGRSARRGVGLDGPLPPRLADGRQAEADRPRPADDARGGGGIRPGGRRREDGGTPDEPRCRRAPGDAVRRRG